MKSFLLGMSVLLFAQMSHAHEMAKTRCAEDVVSLPINSNEFDSFSVACSKKKKKEQDILPPVGQTIFASSNINMNPDGSTDIANSVALTVLNATQGVARVQIDIDTEGRVISREFLIGKSGDQYFGERNDGSGFDILITRVKNNLQVVLTFADEGLPGTTSVSRNIFPLPKHKSCH